MRAGFGVNSSALLATVLAVGMMVVPIHRTEAQSPAATGSAAQKLPADIDPVSRMRLPPVKRADLDDHGKAVWDKVTDTPNDPNTPVTGPSGIRLYSPFVAEHLNAVNQYLRKIPSLRLAELAICNAAREANSPYEWGAHEAAAQKAGVEQEVIDIVKYRKPLPAIGAGSALGGVAPQTTVALAPMLAPRRTRVRRYSSFRLTWLRGFTTFVNTIDGPQNTSSSSSTPS